MMLLEGFGAIFQQLLAAKGQSHNIHIHIEFFLVYEAIVRNFLVFGLYGVDFDWFFDAEIILVEFVRV